MDDQLDFTLTPTWPAPKSIRAFTTTRHSGFSQGPFAQLNLAHHVGDDHHRVNRNRQWLTQAAALPQPPCWLHQIHSTKVVLIQDNMPSPITADAAITRSSNTVCAVMTADCLPLLVTDQQGHEVAAIHAGWRGLLHGIINNAVNQLRAPRDSLLVWLGPAIGPDHFTINEDIRAAFLASNPHYAVAFARNPQGQWHADLYQLARLNLQQLGIEQVFGGGLCTFCDQERFFSYRRDKQTTGRMASVIWIAAD